MHAANAHIHFLWLVVLPHKTPAQEHPLFAPVSRCVTSLGGGEHPAPERDSKPVLGGFEQASGAPEKKQEKGIGAFPRQCPFTAARSASCRKSLRVLEIDAFSEVPRTV